MSVILCKQCEQYIDTDERYFDFVEGICLTCWLKNEWAKDLALPELTGANNARD